MVSIFAPHFFNWTEQLKHSGHEVYWLDVFDSDTVVDQIDFVYQITGWRYRLNYPGRYTIKKKFPALNKAINQLNERDLCATLEKKIIEIQPDVVHSFVMYLGTAPILKVMKRHPNIKWIYSSWGSDLYYYQNIPGYKEAMLDTFPHLDYMFSDCKRDFKIASNNGFKGEFLGVFPGGGGFNISNLDQFIIPTRERNIILIKGYQGIHGKCIEVLKAFEKIDIGKKYNLIVFGANEEVFNYCERNGFLQLSNFEIHGNLDHQRLLEIMGKSLVYIGNSSSDGMPNTLLEAIVMGAFPLQSNPGGATGELIIDRENGMLIQDPMNIEHIAEMLTIILKGEIDLQKGNSYNFKFVRPKLERNIIKTAVLQKYKLVEKSLN